MIDVEKDYHFGWRWLIPFGAKDRVAIVGLSSDDSEWWAQRQHAQFISSDGENAYGWLIALDGCDTVTAANRVNGVNTRWVCAWGSGASACCLRARLWGFVSVREYALLPASNPRVVVPLSSPRFAEAGLCLHRPSRWLARLGLLVARGLVRLGHYGLLRRRVLLIATREAVALSHGLTQAGLGESFLSAQSDFALYLGTPDDNRKTVVLPLGDAPPSVILKVAEMPRACAALQNEARALSTMGQTPLTKHVPGLIALEDTDGQMTLVQEYRQRRNVGHARMMTAVVDFLAGLSELGRKRVALVDWLKSEDSAVHTIMGTCLSPSVEEVASSLRTRLAELASSDGQVWIHRCHGDLAPWNCAWTDRGLFVFDWEESREQGLAMGDAFYYVLSPFVHVQKKQNAGKALTIAIDFASDVATRSGLCAGTDIHCDTEVRMYLALWLLGRLNLSPFYGELAVQLERSWE